MSYYAPDGTIPLKDNQCTNLLSGATCLGCHAGGILPGSLVETDCGSIDISQVKVGDNLLTFDHGRQPVVNITASNVWTSDGVCIKYFWPFYVPTNTLGNTKPVIIMPEMRVLIKHDILKKETGNPYALTPITALVGYGGIKPVVPVKRILSYIVEFAGNELLVLNGGAFVDCKKEIDFLAETANTAHSVPFLDAAETKILLTKIAQSNCKKPSIKSKPGLFQLIKDKPHRKTQSIRRNAVRHSA